MSSSPPTRGATPNSSTTCFIPLSSSSIPALNPLPAPDGLILHYPQPLVSISTAVNGLVQQQENTASASSSDPNPDVDPQIIEALKSKDRIFVLKMGEVMEGLIREPTKSRADVTAATSYQRMLVYRCSTFYKTALESDPITKVFYISLTAESHIPECRISDLVPEETTAQPAIKIMRRAQDRKFKSQSQANSVAGDDGELSDIEPSETGSLGGKSTSTSGNSKKRPTIEEREAAYKEARSRIFMDFEEKEKEKDMSASSSSLSLASGSGGPGSSAGDLDDGSSPATESEWSGSNTREYRKDLNDLKRSSGTSSSRSSRHGPTFGGSTSMRNSRASSPSFKYASIYDAPQANHYYEPHVQYPEPLNPGYHPPQYPAPYPTPGHPPNVPFSPPYQYHPHFNPYQAPPLQPQQHPNEGILPANGDMYTASMGPGNGFAWQNPNQPSAHHLPHPQPPPHPHSAPNQMINTPPHHGQGPQYMPYTIPAYPYPMPGYYPPPTQMLPPYVNPGAVPLYDVPGSTNGAMSNNYTPVGTGRSGINNGVNMSPDGGRNNVRCSSSSAMNGAASKGRSGPTIPPTRSGWSYGPGIGMGGYVAPHGSGDIVGPRLSSSRRQLGNGNGNSGHSRSSNNDDVSSTASSSTTSSSSRRTFTSTTSSQHPLPPRPDWAVGMTPPLYPSHGRHHDHSHGSVRPMSSVTATRNGSSTGPGGPSNMPLPSSTSQQMPRLQPTDFPPLTSATTAEIRATNATGAWGNSNTRSVLLPNQGQQHPAVKSFGPHPNFNNIASQRQFDDSDKGFERPPPKSAELYNHKAGKRPTPNNAGGNGRIQMEISKEQWVRNDALIEQVASMSIAGQVMSANAPPTVNGGSQESASVLTVTT
ncbi:hypothetical protein AX17_002710 [Amanita inopinata Kibby_2008]|nr:hypothetical protein AX17_002710 [Amanita inopinata Kibby_2008]